MSTENIFIGERVPELVRAENGTVLFDKNNLQERDSIVVVGTPDEANTVMDKSELGAQLKRFFIKNGEMVEDTVVEALDDNGYPICDAWESELGGFNPNLLTSCEECVKHDSRDCKEPLARILEDPGITCKQFLSREENEKALDEAYEDISKTYVRDDIESLKDTVTATIRVLQVTALYKVRKDVTDALDLALQALNLAQTRLR